MIVVDLGLELRIITQPDHACFASELLSLWRAGRMPDHSRRADLLFAVREHDNGWREEDAAPRLDPRGDRPVDFRNLPSREREELWRRAILRYAAERPYVALVIAEHARYLSSVAQESWNDLLQHIDTARSGWLAAAGVSEETILEDARILRMVDTLSLALCQSSSEFLADPRHRAQVAGDSLFLNPFPLAGATSFRIPCRYISKQIYSGDRQLAVTLASARWRYHRVRVAPFPAAAGSA